MTKKKQVRRIKHYNSAQKIMLVGEGDLSFSACLATSFGSGLNMVATSLHSEELLKKKYSSSEANVEKLERLGCLVLHEVDVKEMSHHPILKRMKFDVLVFNFPHAGHFHGFNETDAELIAMHKELLRAFFLSARGMINPGGEVHVSHRDDYPYNTWELENLAAKSGFNLKEKVRFEKRDYPGYHNMRGGNINCSKTFPLTSQCFTYKFCLDENYDDHDMQKNDDDDADLIAFRFLAMQKLHKSETHQKAKKKKQRAVEFEVGDFVRAVLTKDRFPIGEYNRLAGQTIGPYEIVDKVKHSSSYRLNLPSHIRTSNLFMRKHLMPYRWDRWIEEPVNLRENSLQRGEDNADLIACRYMDWFEHQVAKYKQKRAGPTFVE